MTSAAVTSTIDEDVQEFHQYAASAVDLSMVHASQTSVLSVIRSCRNWDADQRQSYLYRFNIHGPMSRPATSMPPIPLDTSIKIYLPSPSGNKTIVVKEESMTGGDETASAKKTVVEVWHGPSLVRRIPINEKQHGKVINDAAGFGSPVWSPDETCLLYSAERVPPKTESFWTSTTESIPGNQTPVRGGNNVFGLGQREHWGERYYMQEPILDLYIMNLLSGKIGQIQNVPNCFSPSYDNGSESVTLGQAVWHPSGYKVAFTAWNAGLPRRLGMIYCRNRASKIYETSVRKLLQSLLDLAPTEDDARDNDFVCQSNNLPYARSPRYVQTGESDRLVFLGSERAFVSHDFCMGIYRASSSDTVDCIVPVVSRPIDTGPKLFGMGFPGLFLAQLPLYRSLNGYLVVTSIYGSVQRVLRVDCCTGKVDLISLPQLDETTSQSVCAFGPNGDMIMAATSSTKPASLWFVASESLTQESAGGIVAVDGREIAVFDPVAASVYSTIATTFDIPFKMKVLSVGPSKIDGATSDPIQSILLLPKEASTTKKVPLIVVPHGGPHSCTFSNFVPGFAYLASKYAVLFPNYRGSIGFGQAPADSLLTRIGNVDVQDVMTSTKFAIEVVPEIDGQNIGICGGSHGGFLATHCTAQYPDFFKAAACRNPVTNIASMLTSTDIPDWCFAEAIGHFDPDRYQGPTKDEITAMYEKSPISTVEQVKTPTLVALGKIDLRVPHSQGLEWYHILRSKGIPTKLLLYPSDCHALDRDTTEADHWIHIRKWFDEYLH
ncbi:peptidase S9 prolyl oligopeptidase family protein [Nitzschia inconspicua]|uniref:Peptidase S9 prolyl oligopeptidase family protein n=1 Tax=Nitzschia inconspicua TaxID=303405 RepID=A0A9K3LQ11_9STRA|nr:peptidase S9 prolyl oligopeptidase family protein [Nitzschia inconspicua]